MSDHVVDCTSRDRTGERNGGGMYGGHGEVILTDCVFDSNTASYGGGMYR